MEGWSKKGKLTLGHGPQRGDCWEEGRYKGLHGNGKNTVKIKSSFDILQHF